jgi:hypothetical protein
VVGDRLPVGEAAPDGDHRGFGGFRNQLARDARLPDSGRSDDRAEPARSLLARHREGLSQRFPFALTADERRRRARRDRFRLGQVEQPPRVHRRRPPFDLDRLERLRADVVRDQPVRAFPEQDLPGLGSLLQPGRDIDGIARGEGLAPGPAADEDVPRVHADPDPELDPARPQQLVAE